MQRVPKVVRAGGDSPPPAGLRCGVSAKAAGKARARAATSRSGDLPIRRARPAAKVSRESRAVCGRVCLGSGGEPGASSWRSRASYGR